MRLGEVASLTLGEVLARRARRHPDRVAMVFEDHETTWAELDATVGRLAGGLAAEAGLRKGDRVAILLANREEVVHAYLAAARLGAVAVPINPALGAREVSYLLRDSGARALLTDAAHAEVVAAAEAPALGTVACVDGAHAGMTPYGQLLAAGAPGFAPPEPVGPGDLLVTYYTSGTTGAPKGALHTHFSVLSTALTAGLMMDVSERDRVLLVTPLYHSAAMHVFLLSHALFGGSWTIMRAFDPAAALAAVERTGVTVYFGVVPMLIATLELPDFDRHDLSSLRVLFTGASPVPAALKRRCVEAFRPDVDLIEGYGLTESGPAGTAIHTADALERPGSVGKPWPYLQATVLDFDGNEVPPGEQGEIALRGPTEMAGYHDRPEETAAVFRDGWLRTGDLGRMDDDGFLYVTGRVKDMLIRGGVNVYPREIEEVIYAHEDVVECAVFGVPDERMGEEVMACLTLREGAALDAAGVAALCGELAPYKRPRWVQVVDELPHNATGKILKYRLQERYAEPATRGERLSKRAASPAAGG